MNWFKEWLSDHLRYLVLAGGIALAFWGVMSGAGLLEQAYERRQQTNAERTLAPDAMGSAVRETPLAEEDSAKLPQQGSGTETEAPLEVSGGTAAPDTGANAPGTAPAAAAPSASPAATPAAPSETDGAAVPDPSGSPAAVSQDAGGTAAVSGQTTGAALPSTEAAAVSETSASGDTDLSGQPEGSSQTGTTTMSGITKLPQQFTSADGTVRITLPDQTWRVTQDVDEMRVFRSDDDAVINMVHATTESALGSLTVMRSGEELQEMLSTQYPGENTFEIRSFEIGNYEQANTYRYVIKYNAISRMWAFSVIYAVITPSQAYVVSGILPMEDEALLADVSTAVSSFRILSDDALAEITARESEQVIRYAPSQTGTYTGSVVQGTASSAAATDSQAEGYPSTMISEQPEPQPETQPATEPVTEPKPPEEIETLQVYGESLVRYTTTGANVRSGPGTEFEAITSLDQGTQVTVTGETNEWYRILLDGQNGFIAKRLLTDVYTPVYMTMTGTCYMRSEDDYGDNIIGEYPAGTVVELLEDEGGWVKVRVLSDGNTGYMGARFFH